MNNKKFLSDINHAVDTLRLGGLVAMPTETVYGLGADANNEVAIHKIFAAKERPYNHPLIVHVATVEQLSDWAIEIPEDAYTLAKAFWPGPLTLILRRQPHVLDVVTGGQATVGLRIPRHPVALALLQAFKSGIAAPSANKFTHISPTTAMAVYEELGDRVDVILEGGDCDVGLESTIVDLTGIHPVILRPGMITAEQLSEVLKKPIQQKQNLSTTRVPGMHHLHYAPVTETVMLSTAEITALLSSIINDVTTKEKLPIGIIAQTTIDVTTDVSMQNTQQLIHVKQMPLDATRYAHDIYHTLRTLDNSKLKYIIIEDVPTTAQWDAIRDRLMKAAARKTS